MSKGKALTESKKFKGGHVYEKDRFNNSGLYALVRG